ncbi:MAG: tRNA glutamyl-Q(34) synthetase GluQRS [Gammaproteobacteria bacterium]|nr:tRNA glutamyl-Q(34) synthetase GluQRS [Gammaproteobacteria bacterium]MBQ0839598.1 tRNA glutamyl-Q(34) synthetase GluQRS [Gammaproteobacteria bacterium]
MAVSSYIGRFAPSPTGPLHKGSLLAALASFLDARANHGQWLVRIEDLDPPREVPGAADLILRQLDEHGLHWDGSVLYQSTRLPAYREALQRLAHAGLLYACYCNRARLRTLGGCYDGACRLYTINSSSVVPDKPHAIRIQLPEPSSITVDDLIQGQLEFNLSAAGDFILWRRDHLPAYQLACSLDDGYQNISHVIRGSDLLDSSPRQMHLLRCLNLETPRYGHIPVLSNRQGQKLSKQNHAPELNASEALSNLLDCLRLLGFSTPSELDRASTQQVLGWAIEHWQLANIPSLTRVTESDK